MHMPKLVWSIAMLALVAGACTASVPATEPAPTGAAATPTPTTAATVPATQVPSPPTSTPVPSIDPALPAADRVDPVGTCAGDNGLCTSMDVATWQAIPFTPEVACNSIGTKCRVVANFYGPTHPGDWPLFVLVSGADEWETPDGAHSAYIDEFAVQLAGRGAVVMRANWRRGPGQGAAYPGPLADIACAIGFARHVGAEYGADPSRVVVVGHSGGGWAAAIVGLSATAFAPAADACLETSGSLRPDAWAGMTPAVAVRESFDVFALVEKATPADRLPVALIVGGLDELVVGTRQFAAALDKAGFESVLLVEPDADHYHILERAESIHALMALAARLD